MAAYAALVSLGHIIQQLQHHPRPPPISLDKAQVESLTENVKFLREFLEGCPVNGGASEDGDALESRIADAVHAAEDVIESHIVDQINAASPSRGKKFSFKNFFRCLYKVKSQGEKISSTDLYEGLRKVIQDLDSIKRDVPDITEKTGLIKDDQMMMHVNDSMLAAGSSRRSSSSTGQNNTVGLDDALIEIMDKLTGHQPSRQIIPIVGMGGIGKTTLARNIYEKPLIVQHFDFRGWATISQEYNSTEILLEVLHCFGNKGDMESLSQLSEHELGDKLHKSLSGRRYLIVMDDIWSIEAWDRVKCFFPDNDNGSRIVITARESNLAFELSGSRGLEMSFLDEEKSWNLLCKSVFGEQGCPPELEAIGKKIAKKGKGLPLSIVVIGGLLAKSNQTREHWQSIEGNLKSLVNLEDSERRSRIMRLSYNHLPVHLKPCFLYMGMFPEDIKIDVSSLIRLWVAEGFLKPIIGKSLEVAAEEYLKDLIDRNLILIHELGRAGNIKRCTIHDVLRDLSIKEAEKDKFFRVAETRSLTGIDQSSWHTHRRIGIHQSTSGKNHSRRARSNVMQSASLTRSLIWDVEGVVPAPPFRLLRVMEVVGVFGVRFLSTRRRPLPLKNFCHLVNSRYLAISAKVPKPVFHSSVYQLWNLQTLVLDSHHSGISQQFDIWKMPQLRHVKIRSLKLPDPPTEDNFIVLENLQTLQSVCSFKLGEEVVKRIPNVKKLEIDCWALEEHPRAYCLDNLCRLHKLESISCSFSPFNYGIEIVESLTFPHSLKKLSLEYTHLSWEEIGTKMGSLPHLQVLKLDWFFSTGSEWETVEGQFQSLKYLEISRFSELKYWRTESTHFPCLEHLVLCSLDNLEEIPSEIGDIMTLELIMLDDRCSDSAIDSAQEIVKKQEGLGNDGLRVRVVKSPW